MFRGEKNFLVFWYSENLSRIVRKILHANCNTTRPFLFLLIVFSLQEL